MCGENSFAQKTNDMSKDKGSKDKGNKKQKKAPADKLTGKTKTPSAYKSEGKSGSASSHNLDVFVPKPESKPDKKRG